ncbi:hypothetical protein Tco_0672362 [Tanacetum coccineum]
MLVITARSEVREQFGYSSSTYARRRLQGFRAVDRTDKQTCGDTGILRTHRTQGLKALTTPTGVANCPRARDADRSRNGKDNHDSRTGNVEIVGMMLLCNDLDKPEKEDDRQELALMCARMFPEDSDKIEKYVSGLPDMIYGSGVKTKRKKEITNNNNRTEADTLARAYAAWVYTANANTANNQRGTGRVRNLLAMNVEPRDISRGIGDVGNSPTLSIVLCMKIVLFPWGNGNVDCSGDGKRPGKRELVVKHLLVALNAKVIDAPTIPVSAEENLGDPIDIRVDIIHPKPVVAVAFPAEEISTLGFRMGMAEAENASLCGKIKTMEAIEMVTRSQEKRAHMKMERQLASVQESQRQDRENFRKLQELVTREVRFGKRGKLNPGYVGPSKVIKKVGSVSYKLELPQELSRDHHKFHVSNLKKCYTDEPLAVPLDGLHNEGKLHFIKEPAEIMDREVKWLKQSSILIVEVRWNSRRGCVIRFRKRGKLGPRYIGPFRITDRVRKVAYRIELPEELNSIHITFHVSRLRKCLVDEAEHVPLADIVVDEKPGYVEELVYILDIMIKKLRRTKILLFKVRWKHIKGLDYT